jgi:hypothetical protein
MNLSLNWNAIVGILILYILYRMFKKAYVITPLPNKVKLPLLIIFTAFLVKNAAEGV